MLDVPAEKQKKIKNKTKSDRVKKNLSRVNYICGP